MMMTMTEPPSISPARFLFNFYFFSFHQITFSRTDNISREKRLNLESNAFSTQSCDGIFHGINKTINIEQWWQACALCTRSQPTIDIFISPIDCLRARVYCAVCIVCNQAKLQWCFRLFRLFWFSRWWWSLFHSVYFCGVIDKWLFRIL